MILLRLPFLVKLWWLRICLTMLQNRLSDIFTLQLDWDMWIHGVTQSRKERCGRSWCLMWSPTPSTLMIYQQMLAPRLNSWEMSMQSRQKVSWLQGARGPRRPRTRVKGFKSWGVSLWQTSLKICQNTFKQNIWDIIAQNICRLFIYMRYASLSL